jgi:dienelactone hydrolase
MRRALRLTLLIALLCAATIRAGAGSLPNPAIGPRPGPAVLYQPLANPPQLQNSNGWHAAPIMVSGAQAYRAGEYLYQDYVYDDYGANTTAGPLPPDPVPHAQDVTFGGQTGDVVYPTNAARYAYDAADLLEFRARLDGGSIHYRVTLNSMIDATAAAVAIGIDRAPGGRSDWGYGIGSLGNLGLDDVIVASGDGAHSTDVAGASATVDTATNQIDITVPLSPGGATWRHYVVVGLWNGSAFKKILGQPTAEAPGGSHGTNAPPIFNAGFRFNEPAIRGDLNGIAANPGGSNGVRTNGAGSWREHAQALALAARDISAFHADIDFSKIGAAVNDESGVPKTGFICRLYASHYGLGEGAQPARPMLLGKIQPYGVYVPASYHAGTPAPLMLELHSLAAGYNQYATFSPEMFKQLGDQRGSFILTTEGRGPDGWYHDAAEIDLFEAWGDLAARYDIDPAHVTISGYSMGGYGTYRFASLYPDLFARAFAIVGPADESITGGPTAGAIAGAEDTENTLHILDNMRHVPILMWNGMNDELVPVLGPLNTERRLHDLGYEHRLDLFPGYDHFLFSLRDEWGPGRDWLGSAAVDPNPRHVTYRAFPEMDRPTLGLRHDHAYWLSDIAVAAGARSGLVDAVSRALPDGEANTIMRDVAPFGTAPSPHLQRGLTPVPSVPQAGPPAPANALVLGLTDVSSVVVWPERAGATTGTFTLYAGTNRPATVRLEGTFGEVVVTLAAGRSTTTVTL